MQLLGIFAHIHTMKLKLLTALFAGMFVCFNANGQKFGLKTNLLYDATATVNVGAEIALAPRWTFDLSGNWNPWDMSRGRKWKHWLLQPEARYWFCERFNGHFLGAHLLGGQYNVGNIKNNISFLGTDFSSLTDHRYQGWAVGAGIAYGYSWVLGRHWNLEAEIGFGYAYTEFDIYECAGCGSKVASDRNHHYVGPTKAAINLVYLF